jgi:hypothetical protein
MLYKFRSLDPNGYWQSNLRDHSLWCCGANAFNDPHEFHHELERHPDDVEAVYEYWLQAYPHWQGNLNDMPYRSWRRKY